jgi:hypothetical protein
MPSVAPVTGCVRVAVCAAARGEPRPESRGKESSHGKPEPFDERSIEAQNVGATMMSTSETTRTRARRRLRRSPREWLAVKVAEKRLSELNICSMLLSSRRSYSLSVVRSSSTRPFHQAASVRGVRDDDESS